MRSRSPKPASLTTTSTDNRPCSRRNFCFFQAKLLDHLGGRVSRLVPKYAGKLPYAETGHRGQLVVGERLIQILPDKCKCFLPPVGSGGDVRQSRVLRLRAGSTIEKYEASGYHARKGA
jgi:hypothetical protein